MRVVSLNKNVEKYGFLQEMEYTNDNFHGHQVTLCIGIKNLDGTWNTVFTKGKTEEERINIADNMMNDKSLIILEDLISEVENDEIVAKTIYYLPYYIADHSVYKPTVNFNQIPFLPRVRNKVKIEVLFVKDDWCNRYVTFETTTILSLIDFIKRLESTIMIYAKNKENGFFIAPEDTANYRQGSIVLDFYNKAGEKILIGGNARAFLDMISSIRIIDIDSEIVNDEII